MIFVTASADQKQVRMGMAIFALMMAQQVAARATRDGIFLSQFKSSALPTIVAVAAIAGLILSVGRARTMVRLGPSRTTAVSIANQRRTARRGVAGVARFHMVR